MDIARIVVETETAAVLVTHDVVEALTMSDRIVVIEAGGVLTVGTPDELYRRPPNRAVAEKLGPAAILEAQPAGRDCVTTALGVIATLDGTVVGGPAHALVRPEHLHLVRADDTCGAGRGRVVWSEYRGDTRVVRVALADGPTLAIRTHPASHWRVDDAVQVEVREPVHLLPAP